MIFDFFLPQNCTAGYRSHINLDFMRHSIFSYKPGRGRETDAQSAIRNVASQWRVRLKLGTAKYCTITLLI